MMTEKRFTDVQLDFEESWIKLKDNDDFLIIPIFYSDKEEYCMPTLEDLLNELAEENEHLKEKLDFFQDLAQKTEHEKEDYADKYHNLLEKKFSDDEIRRLYSDLQRREYEKHCSGGTTFTSKASIEQRYGGYL